MDHIDQGRAWLGIVKCIPEVIADIEGDLEKHKVTVKALQSALEKCKEAFNEDQTND